jgi:hypothetical protein
MTIFCSSFDITKFAAEITRRCESKKLDHTMAIPIPKVPPSEVVNSYEVSQYGSNR